MKICDIQKIVAWLDSEMSYLPIYRYELYSSKRKHFLSHFLFFPLFLPISFLFSSCLLIFFLQIFIIFLQIFIIFFQIFLISLKYPLFLWISIFPLNIHYLIKYPLFSLKLSLFFLKYSFCSSKYSLFLSMFIISCDFW